MNIPFENALNRMPQSVPPVWCMRQAGRYHSHYQNLRAKHSFMDLCRDPELAAEVALGPVLDFDFDAAILFSDILFPLEALGMGLSYPEGGPRLGWRLNNENIARLKPPEEALPDLAFQKEALRITRRRLPENKSLIGFVGGPFTLFAYAVEGSHGKGLVATKREIPLFEPFCERIVPLLMGNIELQITGGAEIVMIFDTAAGELSPAMFHEIVIPKLEVLASRHGSRIGYYSKGTGPAHLAHLLFSDGSMGGIGVDHRFNLEDAFRLAPNGFVQGNFDEALLHLDGNLFERELDRFIAPLRDLDPENRAGWICGLGHGVLPKTPEANMHRFVKRIREAFA